MSQLADLVSLEERAIYIHRSTVLDELLELYKDESVTQNRLHVEFLEEPGDDFGGLTKELYTIFWGEATKELFSGEHCVVPSLPLHRVRSESWKFISLGRILSHSVALTKTVPPNLARSFIISLIFDSDVNEQCLLEDFLQYVTEREKKLLLKGMSNFQFLNAQERERLRVFLSAASFFDLPRADKLKEQIISIADQELLKKPAALCSLMRKGIPQNHMEVFWQELSIKHITHIIMQQRPTPERVHNILTTTIEDLSNAQERVFYYLKEFVGTLHQDMLLDFLLFCTGSVHQPQNIEVGFTSLTGMQRRPIAHTCSNILEVPTTYNSFQEFRREFTQILSTPESFQYHSI